MCFEPIVLEEDESSDHLISPCGHWCCEPCWNTVYSEWRREKRRNAWCPTCRLSINRWLEKHYMPNPEIDDSDIDRNDGFVCGDIVMARNRLTGEMAAFYLEYDEKLTYPWVEIGTNAPKNNECAPNESNESRD